MGRIIVNNIVETDGLSHELLQALDTFEYVALEHPEAKILEKLEEAAKELGPPKKDDSEKVISIEEHRGKEEALRLAGHELLWQAGIQKVTYAPEIEEAFDKDSGISVRISAMRKARSGEQAEIRDEIVRRRLAIAFGRFAIENTDSESSEVSKAPLETPQAQLENAS